MPRRAKYIFYMHDACQKKELIQRTEELAKEVSNLEKVRKEVFSICTAGLATAVVLTFVMDTERVFIPLLILYLISVLGMIVPHLLLQVSKRKFKECLDQMLCIPVTTMVDVMSESKA